MRKFLLVPALVLALLSEFACSEDSTDRYEQPPSVVSLASEESTALQSLGYVGSPASVDSMWADRKLIRSAIMHMEVESVETTLEALSAIANSMSGIVAGSQLFADSDEAQRGVLTVRVPSANFESILKEIKILGDVKQSSVSTRDITKEYTDLETRLIVKQKMEKRLLHLLETRPGELPDVLTVERELSRVITELESMKGDRRYYDQQVAVSTITIHVSEPEAEVIAQEGSGVISTAFRRSMEILTVSFAGIIYVVVFVAPWLVVAGVIWFLIQFVKKRRHSGNRER